MNKRLEHMQAEMRARLSTGSYTYHRPQLEDLPKMRPRTKELSRSIGSPNTFRCGHPKTEDNTTNKDRTCKACSRERGLNSSRKRYYGHDAVEYYEEQFSRQKGLCAVCRNPARERALAQDHDHKCCPSHRKTCGKCKRGLLCSVCNQRIACLEDPAWFDAAMEYLNSWSGAANYGGVCHAAEGTIYEWRGSFAIRFYATMGDGVRRRKHIKLCEKDESHPSKDHPEVVRLAEAARARWILRETGRSPL